MSEFFLERITFTINQNTRGNGMHFQLVSPVIPIDSFHNNG